MQNLKIISVKNWLNCKPEDRKSLIEKSIIEESSKHKEMTKFIEAVEYQKELKSFQEAMKPEDYFEAWQCYEDQQKMYAQCIKKSGLINKSCKMFPKYKDVLLGYINVPL